MVFNGLEKSELVIYNILADRPKKCFHIIELECLTGYSYSTISNALRRLQKNGYITYRKEGRFKPYHFEIKDKSRVVLNA